NSNTVPGTTSPAIARHSTKATMNTAAASHCGFAASHPVTLSSHGPIKTTPSEFFYAPKGKYTLLNTAHPSGRTTCGEGARPRRAAERPQNWPCAADFVSATHSHGGKPPRHSKPLTTGCSSRGFTVTTTKNNPAL